MAVSYTHLDVDQRQRLSCILEATLHLYLFILSLFIWVDLRIILSKILKRCRALGVGVQVSLPYCIIIPYNRSFVCLTELSLTKTVSAFSGKGGESLPCLKRGQDSEEE